MAASETPVKEIEASSDNVKKAIYSLIENLHNLIVALATSSATHVPKLTEAHDQAALSPDQTQDGTGQPWPRVTHLPGPDGTFDLSIATTKAAWDAVRVAGKKPEDLHKALQEYLMRMHENPGGSNGPSGWHGFQNFRSACDWFTGEPIGIIFNVQQTSFDPLTRKRILTGKLCHLVADF